MPAERLPMRKVREVLRLRYACGASERVIAQSLGIGRTAVGEYIRRAAVIGITWPVPEELDDAALERKLFAPAGYNPPRSKPLPDWAYVHAELRRRSVTLALLWQDYRVQHPDGYGYSRFCDLYGEWRRGVTATMRQTHVAGEKLFVDFAGDTMPVFDAITGEVRDTKIFVAVLGASNYTYAEARFSEGLPDWIGAHVNALAFLGGVPKAIVCDNLKAGVTTASRYEPGVNRTYQDLATHYGTTMQVLDGATGEVIEVQLFVAVLGASSHTWAEATWTQTLPDWIGSHTRAFAFFGGVAAMVVSDNLKAGIAKACFYEPSVNRSYAEMAAHYGTAVTGSAKLTQGGKMNLTHPAKWFLRCGGTDAEGGGSDGVGGFAQAWREYPGAGADDGAIAEYGAALLARRRDSGTPQANREAG